MSSDLFIHRKVQFLYVMSQVQDRSRRTLRQTLCQTRGFLNEKEAEEHQTGQREAQTDHEKIC